jgi:hypothetical protein
MLMMLVLRPLVSVVRAPSWPPFIYAQHECISERNDNTYLLVERLELRGVAVCNVLANGRDMFNQKVVRLQPGLLSKRMSASDGGDCTDAEENNLLHAESVRVMGLE